MNTLTAQREIAIIAAIITHNIEYESLRKYGSTMDMYERIANMAELFYISHQHITEWEDYVLTQTALPQSTDWEDYTVAWGLRYLLNDIVLPQNDHIITQDDWQGTIKQWAESNLLDRTVTPPYIDEVRAVLSLGINESTQVGLFTIKRIA